MLIVNITIMRNADDTMSPPLIDTLEAWIKDRRFDFIAKKLGMLIYEICPFRTREAYDAILIGNNPAPGIIKHCGYLGWKIFATLPESTLTVEELKECLKLPKTKAALKNIYNYSQIYLIGPITRIIIKLCDVEDPASGKYKSEIHRFLNIDKLDGQIRKGYVISEICQRMVHQGILQKYKIRGHVYHKTISNKDYEPPIFDIPTRLGYSKGHCAVLGVLEPLIAKWNEEGVNKWRVESEYPNPDKHGFPKPMRYDIALFKNGKLYALFEYDGKQHKEYIPHFHRPKNGKRKDLTPEEETEGRRVFEALKKKDVIKNRDAIKLCQKCCLRFHEMGRDYIRKRIHGWFYDYAIY